MMQNTSFSLIVDGMDVIRWLNCNAKTMKQVETNEMRESSDWSRGRPKSLRIFSGTAFIRQEFGRKGGRSGLYFHIK